MRRPGKWFVIALILAGNIHADEPPSAARDAALKSTVTRRKAERERKAAAAARRRLFADGRTPVLTANCPQKRARSKD